MARARRGRWRTCRFGVSFNGFLETPRDALHAVMDKWRYSEFVQMSFTSRPDAPKSGLGAAFVGRKLQREIILLLAWAPAILLQLSHPLVARGIADHSAFRREKHGHVGRFYRTLNAMLQLCFGSEREALAVLARINAIHDRVNGELPEAAGVFAAGTPYSAHDPALLTWVHATLLDMNIRVYELYVGSLSGEEKNRYCAEACAIESHLGIPSGSLPRNISDLSQYIEAMLSSGNITITDTARTLARSILYPQVPRIVEPAVSFARLATIGMLPPAIRDGYGYPWNRRRQVMLNVSAGVIRNVLRVTPRFVRHWPAARRGDSRGAAFGRHSAC
jgi:uncharacterized protein (DUF2236 family)